MPWLPAIGRSLAGGDAGRNGLHTGRSLAAKKTPKRLEKGAPLPYDCSMGSVGQRHPLVRTFDQRR
jgi:hypothetical protein